MALTNYVLMPGTDYLALCNAIRAKTGKTETLKSGDLATEVESITGGGGAQITEYLPETTFTNRFVSTFGVYIHYALIDADTMEAWATNRKNVTVVYDNVEYNLTPQLLSDGAGGTGIGVGNAANFGGTGNGEPFLIVQWALSGDPALLVASMVDTAPTEHTIRIYQEVSGGGSVEGVHTVTFMTEDGSAVLYERLVVDGDDCANVVDRGLLAAPTKESTAQYNYTHSGWSLTSGGSADASALSSVTADRTVYAAFNSSTRYYTITYYDSDGATVLRTDTLPYGSTPNYMPEKDGASFTGWNPALATVTGDASYTAAWQEKVTFAGGSWADIAEISESGQAAQYFKVGDERDVVLTKTDGTTETIRVAIAGFDHDDLSDGSGKAGLSIVCMTVPSFTSVWAGYSSTGHYPYFSTYPSTTPHSKVRTQLNSTVFEMLPLELRSVIKSVSKVCDASQMQGTSTKIADDMLWPLSVTEMGHNVTNGTYTAGLGSRYELFPSQSLSSKVLPIVTITDSGEVCKYWTRSIERRGTYAPIYIYHQDNYGNVVNGSYACNSSDDALKNTERHIRFGFCI